MIATSETLKPVEQVKESQKFYRRLHSMLSDLEKIEGQLPREQFAPFVKAYSQHWLHSVKHGDEASSPRNYYNEWAEVQQLGQIPMDTETDHFYHARRYRVYESPREKARRLMGFDDEDGQTNGASVRPNGRKKPARGVDGEVIPKSESGSHSVSGLNGTRPLLHDPDPGIG
ncbi:MAG: hypothetical protein MOB07_16295 [Acidobacteria bacterium]|nr:hypothetical protein [Acidobacteriota bacterium]